MLNSALHMHRDDPCDSMHVHFRVNSDPFSDKGAFWLRAWLMQTAKHCMKRKCTMPLCYMYNVHVRTQCACTVYTCVNICSMMCGWIKARSMNAIHGIHWTTGSECYMYWFSWTNGIYSSFDSERLALSNPCFVIQTCWSTIHACMYICAYYIELDLRSLELIPHSALCCALSFSWLQPNTCSTAMLTCIHTVPVFPCEYHRRNSISSLQY